MAPRGRGRRSIAPAANAPPPSPHRPAPPRVPPLPRPPPRPIPPVLLPRAAPRRAAQATDKENMGYLLSWAAGSRELLPFLHKLLLLRDVVREDFGLPGGLHETARPDAYDEADDSVRALFSYRSGSGAGAADLVAQPPLLVAAQRGNAEALHLLLLFGEGVHARRKGNERALYAACEQGNVACVAALLGRVPLRPPKHPPHSARRLGLVRPSFSVYGPGFTYAAGVRQGALDVPAAIAGAKIRAEYASATGISTGSGTRASLTAAAAAAAPRGLGNAGLGMAISATEAAVGQTESFESDGRYRHWCRGYRMGTYWATYDTALAAYEALHGPIGELADIAMPPPLTADGQVSYKDGTKPTVDQMAQDVTAFLVWTAEPKLEKRHQSGVPVVLFLIFATVLAYMAYRNVWAEKKGH